MLNRRSLFKVLAAMGVIVSGLSSRVHHALGRERAAPHIPGRSASGRGQPGSLRNTGTPLSMILMAEQWEDLADDLDCAEVAARFTSLEEGGASLCGRSNWRGRCPFCRDSGSFHVDLRSFGCEGCGLWGGPVDLYARAEGVGPTTAMSRLQDLLERGTLRGNRAAQIRVCMLMEEAAAFYHRLLCESRYGEPGRMWLKHHGLTRQSVERFRLGYAPRLPNGLLAEHLVSRGYGVDAIERAGLAFWERPKSWKVRDYHNGDTILVPVRDGNGRSWGFLEQAIVDGKPAVSQFDLEAMQRLAPNRFRRLVFPAPTWPQDFHRHEKIFLANEPIEVVKGKQNGLDNVLYIGDLAASHEDPRFRLRTALSMGERLVYQIRNDVGAYDHNLDDLIRQFGACLDRVEFAKCLTG